MVEAAGLGLLFVLAFGNGANDVGKSVAALMTNPETATFKLTYGPLVWGGLFSGLGSVCAILISSRLFSVFTPDSFLQTTPGHTFILAALAGAAAWILAGTLLRIPVSTTHAIVGAIVLQAAYLFGTSNLEWEFLFWRVALPLAAGPFAALLGVYLLTRLTHRQHTPRVEASTGVKVARWGSAAASSFARGINNAPKMAALGAFFLLATPSQAEWLPYLIVAVALVMGSLVWGDRVARTLVGKTTPNGKDQKVQADVATATILSAGAYFGEAFSTTQVSEGAAAGTGRGEKKRLLRSALRGMALAWLVTLPVAGILAIAASFLSARLWG